MALLFVLLIVFLICISAIYQASEDAEKRASKDAEKASHKIAFLEDVNGDAVADIVVKDGNGLLQFVLFGQPDGSFKNLEKILYDFSQSSKEESDKIREKYKRLE